MLPAYAELHCRSCFSFLTGASRPTELVAEARRRGYAALAITDEGSLSGVVHAHEAAREAELPLVIGAQMDLSPRPQGDGAVLAGHGPPRLVLLAQTRRGYGNLAQWISVARRRAPKGQYLAHAADLEGRVPQAPFLAGLPGCFAILAPRPGQGFEAVYAQAMWLKTWFGADRCAIAITLLGHPQDAQRLAVLPRVSALTGLPLVACGDVLMHARARKPLQDALTATRLGCTVAAAGLALAPNAEAHLRSRQRLARLYAPAWLAASVAIAASCSFSLTELRYEYPEEIVPPGHSPTSWLRALTEAGVRDRFPAGAPPAVLQTIEDELALIAQLKFEPYFLTVADIVQWARSQGILCQGRGSAANSVVCFCLGVTEVNPTAKHMTLLFGRFISAERNEPPDIDIDFEHQRREEVIQYIYRKYGRHRAALTGVMISYRPRSALRDIGRALGIDIDRINAVSKGQQWWDGRGIAPERLAEQGFDPDSPVCRQWLELTRQLIGFPRHLSQHPGGFVIARDDISRLVPVENAAMDDRTVIQWDKDDLDALGLIKVDILALGMLSAIRRALAMVAAKQGLAQLQMHQLPQGDDAVYDMLCRADSIGTFQVESRAQMSMLPRLKPREFYDLVIEVAIVRPGPIQGGMVHPYLRRRSGEEPEDYPNEAVRQALGRTKGVPIFQEQVMQLAILAADFTPGEADALRRAMAAWKRKGGLGPFHERLVGRMVAKGYDPAYAERIFKQIEGFGEYGFPESHAASFALLVYVSAWLKCHHPDAFLAALLNSQPMGFYAPAQLVRDARAHGVQVRPVDVLHSDWDTVLEGQGGEDGDGLRRDAAPGLRPDAPPGLRPGAPPVLRPVRLGLNRIIGLAEADARRLLAARAALAPGEAFASVEDLARRAALDAHALQLLAQADALRSLASHRHQAAWAVRGIDTRATPLLQATRTHEAPADLQAPGAGQALLADYRSTGLSLTSHPLALLRDELAAFQVQPAAVLALSRHGQLVRASGLVTHRQRPETAKGVVFVTLEDETGAVNVIVWPTVAEAQRQPLLAATLLTVYGVWQRDREGPDAVQHLVARRLVDHSGLLQGLVSKSRDFH
ncbi:error-prone DNA polymerase [Pseudaquabacterium pictum]|uniref:Error-prone DNA polymerase n=1 Tax=Pseudaquabacterium pictum TaxID=2315236 RepID=A0A480ANL1_9BURK|nr:error-prone DNA polymerase [Rubrivivax pictus]GCL62596.1 error-prone DNA polymerase [Rubrivivax pictus]